MPSPKRRAETEKEALVAGTTALIREDGGTRMRAERRDERKERAREDGAASWRTVRRTDMTAVRVHGRVEKSEGDGK